MILRYIYTLRKVAGTRLVTSDVVELALRRLVPQAREIGDKHPMDMMRLPDLVLEENLKIIVIYRDCRDVVSSVMQKVRTDWKNKRWVGKIDTPEKIARRWVDSCLLIERYADSLHVMRYEDLVTLPAQHLHRLGEYLEVDPDGFPALNIRTNSIGKYRFGLTDRELAHVMTIAGPTMTRFGYE